jgi:hypothetical protein
MHAHNSANADLVLEVLPNGEPAWLKPERRSVLASRFWLTDEGRDALAELRRDKADDGLALEREAGVA